jgi:hypothetical protein
VRSFLFVDRSELAVTYTLVWLGRRSCCQDSRSLATFSQSLQVLSPLGRALYRLSEQQHQRNALQQQPLHLISSQLQEHRLQQAALVMLLMGLDTMAIAVGLAALEWLVRCQGAVLALLLWKLLRVQQLLLALQPTALTTTAATTAAQHKLHSEALHGDLAPLLCAQMWWGCSSAQKQQLLKPYKKPLSYCSESPGIASILTLSKVCACSLFHLLFSKPLCLHHSLGALS